MKPHFDVMVIGGGMVGSLQALALAKTHPEMRIALIEANRPAQLNSQDNYDLRVSALTKSTEMLLKNLGLWTQLDHQRICPFTDMIVWETQAEQLHFDSADMGTGSLGHLIENRHLQVTCLAACDAQANLTLMTPSRVSQYETGHITLDNGHAFSASLVIAADGAQSPIRQMAGISTQHKSYQQQGLVCTVTTELTHQLTAWQRFLADGPLAFLPLADPHQCSIVWTVNDDHAARLLGLNDADFMHELQQAFESRLGRILAVSERASFPLNRQHAQTYIAEQLALVGDAAHTIHPLAGQGVNIGLLDVASLTDVVSTAWQQGRSIGSLHTLQKYQRQRRADNLLMQLSMDAFKQTFSTRFGPLQWARRLGMKTINQQTWLKNLIMQQAASRPFATTSLIRAPFDPMPPK